MIASSVTTATPPDRPATHATPAALGTAPRGGARDFVHSVSRAGQRATSSLLADTFATTRGNISHCIASLEARCCCHAKWTPRMPESFTSALNPAGRKCAMQVVRTLDRLQRTFEKKICAAELRGAIRTIRAVEELCAAGQSSMMTSRAGCGRDRLAVQVLQIDFSSPRFSTSSSRLNAPEDNVSELPLFRPLRPFSLKDEIAQVLELDGASDKTRERTSNLATA